MRSYLSKSGYHLDEETGVWIKPGYAAISYSDGDEVEERLADIFSKASDVSVLSSELKVACTDWPSLYHLSSERANLLRPFKATLDKATVLEIGSGCGAITRYLGESNATVLALEGSSRRAKITRLRTRDLNNVHVVSDQFDQFSTEQKFDIVTLIGVLEYASVFTSGNNPPLTMIQRARSFLKPNGKLIIAIENQLGLKYFAGAPEDHIGKPMYGLEGQYREKEPTTYGRKMLATLLSHAGFARSEFSAPFPDYKFPVSIVTQQGFSNDSFDVSTLVAGSVRTDPQLPPLLAFSPELVWPSLVKNGVALDLANSFLIIAYNADEVSLTPNILAYHYSTRRADVFCKETLFVQNEQNKITVCCNLINPVAKLENENNQLLQHHIVDASEYIHGRSLQTELIEIVTHDGWKIEEVGQFLRKYFQILTWIASKDGLVINIDSPHTLLPWKYFDLVPQNIIIRPDGTPCVIDSEWNYTDSLSVGYMVFRVLFLLFTSISRFGKTSDVDIQTLKDFIFAVYEAIAFEIDKTILDSYYEKERVIYDYVTQKINWSESKPVDFFINFHSLCKEFIEQSNLTNNLKRLIDDRDIEINNLKRLVDDRDTEIGNLNKRFLGIIQSNSWRLTLPLREIKRWLLSPSQQCKRYKRILGNGWSKTYPLRRVFLTRKNLVKVLNVIRVNGGFRKTGLKILSICYEEGISGINKRVQRVFPHEFQGHVIQQLLPRNRKFKIIPYYIGKNLEKKHVNECGEPVSIGIHLHLYCVEALDEFILYLNNVPSPYDLYISIPNVCNRDQVFSRLQVVSQNLKTLIVEAVPNKGKSIAPLIVQFGRRLVKYDVIAHLHTSEKLHDPSLSSENKYVLDLLMGLPKNDARVISEIIDLLMTKAKLVYSEANINFILNATWWDSSYKIVQRFLKKYTALIKDFPKIEFPQGIMFWARANCMKDFLRLKLKWSDFSDEPIHSNDNLADVLESCLLIFSCNHNGNFYRIHQGNSIKDYKYYEEQKDYSSLVVHNDIKILSYYLPQFHPIPENDLWHGEGFTEWTKVRAATPLFEGHYQQHIPHQYIGYYLIDSDETLKKQADLMRQAGVYGQVFYHYWFSGKLILEKPAKLLLANIDINMRFCFCWANENWTRCWDGNEREILLEQVYSSHDAINFIQYLIPFFLDSRYIRINDRPVLFVYRSSSIPNVHEYLDAWEKECAKAGLKKPYVVAALTRGATNPYNFGMDAGVERVLHDWTGGAVSEMQSALNIYEPINGSVLSYSDVANFYSKQMDLKEFTYFRSVIPNWDNTARYGNEAFLLHGSTPLRFQQWLEDSITYTKLSLPENKRFILINAWNEWAEGAHLEPDSRYGFSYLNAVGRSLSGITRARDVNVSTQIPRQLKLHLSFTDHIKHQIKHNEVLKRKFIFNLLRSTIFNICSVSHNLEDIELFANFKFLDNSELESIESCDYVLQFRSLVILDSFCIERMLESAICSPNFVVICNCYGRNDYELIDVSENGSIDSIEGYDAPLFLAASSVIKQDFQCKCFKMRRDARCFLFLENSKEGQLPMVSTIIRLHQGSNLLEFKNALYCLFAMKDCFITPVIMAQDLSQYQILRLEDILSNFNWRDISDLQLVHYCSSDKRGDLRSKMLNESLKLVKTRYVAFLDHDDLLMPHAYSWLLERLSNTQKAIAFGRIYSSICDTGTLRIIKRERKYEYGCSYEDFINQNCNPIHTYMLDLEQINLNSIEYFDDHKYMEDYYLMLQLVTPKNADWEGLRQNFYIGDYIVHTDRQHTLANFSTNKTLIDNIEYITCEARINDLRKSILTGAGKFTHVSMQKIIYSYFGISFIKSAVRAFKNYGFLGLHK